MNTCNCMAPVEKVYCESCEHYKAPSVHMHAMVFDLCCKKYTEVHHYPTHRSTTLGDVAKLNANNSCEGYQAKKLEPKPGAFVVMETDDPGPMPVSLAMTLAAIISVAGCGLAYGLLS